MIDNIDIISIIHEIGLEVRNFTKHRSGDKYNWSCDVCGDSMTDRRKARFGIGKKDSSWVCHCFNCGYSNSFVGYLKDFHPRLYERYNTDKFISNAPVLYDLNPLFGKLSDRKLINIFYITKYREINLWFNYLKHKKIQISKNNLEILFRLHKNYWRNKDERYSSMGNTSMRVVQKSN